MNLVEDQPSGDALCGAAEGGATVLQPSALCQAVIGGLGSGEYDRKKNRAEKTEDGVKLPTNDH